MRLSLVLTKYRRALLTVLGLALFIAGYEFGVQSVNVDTKSSTSEGSSTTTLSEDNIGSHGMDYFVLYYTPFGEAWAGVFSLDYLKSEFAHIKTIGIVPAGVNINGLKPKLAENPEVYSAIDGEGDIWAYAEFYDKTGQLLHSIGVPKWGNGYVLWDGKYVHSTPELLNLVKKLIPVAEADWWQRWMDEAWNKPGKLIFRSHD